MATMYPKSIEFYGPTESEKKVFKALRDQLPETYSVFYSIQWVDDVHGEKVESECDFLIFNEQEGFLTCEVKGGTGYKYENGKYILLEKDGQRELKRSPMEQSEESSRYFYRLYSKTYNNYFSGVYGSISIFPFYKVDDPVLLDNRPKEIVFDISDMNNLGKKIQKAFSFYKGKKTFLGNLTNAQKTNFKEMIYKKVASQASAGSIIEQKENELEIVNRVQDNLVCFLENYNRTFISGGAGTGKTWIACKFALRAYQNNKDTLFVVHSKHLVKMLKGLLPDNKKINVTTFDELVCSDGVSSNKSNSDLVDAYEKKNFKKYDAIIVDEAQDFDQYQALVVSMHLKGNSSEFRVFYDETQNIFDKDFKDGFDIDYPPFILKENLRNTSNVYEWASNKTGLGQEVATNQVIGPTPVEAVFKNDFDVLKYIETELVKLVDEESVPLSSITLLFDEPNYQKYFGKEIGRWICSTDSGNNSVSTYLVEDFKGLESDIIIYCHNQLSASKYDYVAYTRAKFYLYNLIVKK